MGKIIALVLAAGFSSRMKRNKMLLPFAGKTVIEQTVQRFLQSMADKVYVVVGNEKDKIQQVLSSYSVKFIENPRYIQGMSSSVLEGISVLNEEDEVGGVMIIPGDMPLIRTETVDAVIERFRESSYPVIIPVYEGKKGHPVFFAKSMFPQLMEITGDVGARDVVRRNHKQCFLLNVKDQGILIDIDSPEEYANWVTIEGTGDKDYYLMEGK